MQIVFLTQVGGILKPFAWILGEILNAIYKFVGLFSSTEVNGNTIANLALCIVFFTLVVKMLMLPLTIKQQKFTKLSSKMNPELQRIQAKYKGKRDEVSLRRQQEETQEVYRRYGASPMSGCLPLLISLPILFALYRVIYAIPAYVTDIGNLYTTVANSVHNIDPDLNIFTSFVNNSAIQVNMNEIFNYNPGSEAYINSLIDILAKFNPTNWDAFFNIPEFSSFPSVVKDSVDGIINAHTLFGISSVNILDTPSIKSFTVIIPILAAGFQFLQGKMQGGAAASDPDNPAAQSAKMMTTIMPIMSGVFCLMLPIGVGIYWIATSVFTIVQTIFINKYLDNTDINEMLEKAAEKETKRIAKLGVGQGDKVSNTIKSVNNTAKNYDNSYDNSSYKKNNSSSHTKKSGADYKRSNVSYSASNIAANAMLLARKDEKPESNKSDEE